MSVTGAAAAERVGTDARRNNVGVLRLLLASLVIVGHSPELIDGDPLRDPLFAWSHAVTLAGVAVEGFFLLSGFLVTQSLVRGGALRGYFARRVLRIAPGFLVAYVLTVCIMPPLVGGQPLRFLPSTLLHLVTLRTPPDYPGILSGLHYPLLAGALWTISHEFHCYILVALLWVSGALRRRRWVLGATLVALALLPLEDLHRSRVWLDHLGRTPGVWLLTSRMPFQALRLTTTFMVGVCAYLYWPELEPRLNGRAAAACAALAVLVIAVVHLDGLATKTLGAYALFWLAFRAELGPLRRVNNSWDISYGVYLYGWQIATLLLWFDRAITPAAMIAATLPLACLCGAASWWGVESWSKDLARPRRPRPLAGAVAVGP